MFPEVKKYSALLKKYRNSATILLMNYSYGYWTTREDIVIKTNTINIPDNLWTVNYNNDSLYYDTPLWVRG